MKNIISLSVLALFSLGLFAACGGSSGPSCDDVCNKMMECDPESQESDLTECLEQCAIFKDAFRDDVYSELGDCFMENSCAALDANESLCFDQAAALGDIEAVKGLIADMCVKIVDCDETDMMTQETCVSNMEDNAEEELPLLGMFKDSVLNCAADCVGNLDCADLNDDDAIGGCMENCGLIID